MNTLHLRSNILVKTFRNIRVYIYEDHRSILNILRTARDANTLKAATRLIYFDKHDDAKPPLPSNKQLSQLRHPQGTTEDFWHLVEWELSGLDDDWLIAGMELDLISDALLIGASITPNISNSVLTHTDSQGTKHSLFLVSHIWDGLSHQGWLVDVARQAQLQPIWDLLEWTGNGKGGVFNSTAMTQPLVVDFDLDCFTTDLLGSSIPWPKRNFHQLFNEQPNTFWSAKLFLHELFDKASFITIARESTGCGSLLEANQVMDSLNEVLFDGLL